MGKATNQQASLSGSGNQRYSGKPSWVRTITLRSWIVALSALLSTCGYCESLRVTTWNLGLNSSVGSYTRKLDEAAAVLKELSPDVILLQQVPDWRACTQLAAALEPLDYHVVVCSSFPARGAQPPAQVAILAKRNAYFTWTEASPAAKGHLAESGLVFAAIQGSTQRLGFFSACFQQSGEGSLSRVLADIRTFRGWETNQVQTFIVAASEGTLVQKPNRFARRWAAALDKEGLISATEELGQQNQISSAAFETVASECFFAGPMGFPYQPRITNVPGFALAPVTCELELDPDRVTAAIELRAARLDTPQPALRMVREKMLWWCAGTIGLACLVVGAARRGRKRRRASVRPHVHATALQARPVIVVSKVVPAGPDEGVRPATTLRLKTSPRLALRAGERRTELPIAQPNISLPPEASPQPCAPVPEAPLTAKLHRVENPEVREGVVRELASWLKHKFVRKLVQDRSELIEAQQLATRMAVTLDSRLARIEAQIQVQNQAYLARIEELNRELAAAREENRELIRERIAQVKAEMEAARARVLAEAQLDNSSLRL